MFWYAQFSPTRRGGLFPSRQNLKNHRELDKINTQCHFPFRFRLRKRILRIFLCGTFDFKHGDCFSGTYNILPAFVQLFLSGMNEGKINASELKKILLKKITEEVIRTIQEKGDVGTCIRLPASIFFSDTVKPTIVDLDAGESSIIVNITKILRES